MNRAVPPGESAGSMTPAEREARWALSVRFAIEASSEAEARAILSQALTQCHLAYLSIKALTCMFVSDGRSGPL